MIDALVVRAFRRPFDQPVVSAGGVRCIKSYSAGTLPPLRVFFFVDEDFLLLDVDIWDELDVDIPAGTRH